MTHHDRCPERRLPTDNDSYGYTWTQTGDPSSGTFEGLSKAGTTRYDPARRLCCLPTPKTARPRGT